MSYSYENNNILNDININFEKDKKYVIVGESGSGKSTLLNILGFRLTDYNGKILVNDKNIDDFDLNSIRSQIIYIDQDPYIFTGSIKDNITLFDDFSDEKICEILDKVRLSQFVINEDASKLSGGQKQRVAIARGLIRNKQIILLDEITSNQDIENTKQIEKLILEDKNLTTIFITHNLRDDVEKMVDKKIDLTKL